MPTPRGSAPFAPTSDDSFDASFFTTATSNASPWVRSSKSMCRLRKGPLHLAGVDLDSGHAAARPPGRGRLPVGRDSTPAPVAIAAFPSMLVGLSKNGAVPVTLAGPGSGISGFRASFGTFARSPGWGRRIRWPGRPLGCQLMTPLSRPAIRDGDGTREARRGIGAIAPDVPVRERGWTCIACRMMRFDAAPPGVVRSRLRPEDPSDDRRVRGRGVAPTRPTGRRPDDIPRRPPGPESGRRRPSAPPSRAGGGEAAGAPTTRAEPEPGIGRARGVSSAPARRGGRRGGCWAGHGRKASR